MSNQPPEVLVTTVGDGYEQLGRSGEHSLRADEPVEVGGTDNGPDPFELLLISLGACTSMTVNRTPGGRGGPLQASQLVSDTPRCTLRIAQIVST